MNNTIRFCIAVCIIFLNFYHCSFHPTEPRRSARETLTASYRNLTASLMTELELLRGKPFIRTVGVAVYTREEYKAKVAGMVNDMSVEQRNMINDVYIRENLLRPGMDYFDDYDSMMSSSVGGFYMGGTDTINILINTGEESISAYDSVIIFHELVHGLQDQYYDLGVLQDNASSSDEYYAIDYVIEGEAELLSEYYSFKKAVGTWPLSPEPIVEAFTEYNIGMERYIDSLHVAGEPLVRVLPFYWAYYSYGPLFISTVANSDWSVIDNTIFASPPLKTIEVMQPTRYTGTRNVQILNMNTFMETLSATQQIIDFDELGYMMRCVMFREWGSGSWKTLHQGILADNIIVYREGEGQPLRLIWYTKWDGSNSDAFVDAYTTIVEARKGISLPSGTVSENGTVIHDAVSSVYIEQRDSSVIILEDYLPQYLDTWLEQLRLTSSYNPLWKKVAGRKYPRIDKEPVMKNIW